MNDLLIFLNTKKKKNRQELQKEWLNSSVRKSVVVNIATMEMTILVVSLVAEIVPLVYWLCSHKYGMFLLLLPLIVWLMHTRIKFFDEEGESSLTAVIRTSPLCWLILPIYKMRYMRRQVDPTLSANMDETVRSLRRGDSQTLYQVQQLYVEEIHDQLLSRVEFHLGEVKKAHHTITSKDFSFLETEYCKNLAASLKEQLQLLEEKKVQLETSRGQLLGKNKALQTDWKKVQDFRQTIKAALVLQQSQQLLQDLAAEEQQLTVRMLAIQEEIHTTQSEVRALEMSIPELHEVLPSRA